MPITVSMTDESPLTQVADAIVVGVTSEGALAGAALRLDQATNGLVTRLRERGDFAGKLAETLPLHSLSEVKAHIVLLVGMGKPSDWSITSATRCAGAAAKWLAGKSRKAIALYLAEGQTPEVAEAMICSALLGAVGQDLHRTQRKLYSPEQMLWSGVSADSIARGKILGDACNLTRRLVNEPPNLLYPQSFAVEAERVAGEGGLECEIWDEKRLLKERCGSLLAVARGSANPPRMVILRYEGGPKGKAPLALVGKGVTFDSGGLSLKPTEGMITMKCDMAGAATVLGAMQAISQLKLPINVVGLVGLVENMVSGNCLKLGDVITARSGKTIEVLNTDAEGRLVLADVLDVAKERGAAKIVDLATLTGACVVALGTDVGGVMSNSEALSKSVLAAAKSAGELAWPLPMFREFDEQIQSDIADLKNVGNGRWGGAITAAKFLEAFVGETPWCHVDIAGPAFGEKPKSWIDGGATAYFLRTLVELCRREAA
jgi:leucyl aminopeptidase